MKYYILLVITIACELVGTTFLKSTEGFTRLVPSLLTIVAYGICYFCFSKVLMHMHLSVAYALWSGLGILVTTAASVYLYKQSITPLGVFGIILILAGVTILNLSGNQQ